MFLDFLRTTRCNPKNARESITNGTLATRLRVTGVLDFTGETSLRTLPTWLEAEGLDLSKCPKLEELPLHFRGDWLRARQSGIRQLPPQLFLKSLLDVAQCPRLSSIPAVNVRRLLANNCLNLRSLEEGVSSQEVDLANCSKLKKIPNSVAKSVVLLNLSGCVGITSLPGGFSKLERLDVTGCSELKILEEGIRIRSSIDIADSGLEALPWSLRSTRILWRGVQIPDDVAFEPSSITVNMVLEERDPRMRTVLLQRMGLKRFLAESDPEIVDSDLDSGGTRSLFRLKCREGDDLSLLSVSCPSTRQHYVLRVPHNIATAHAAAAWLADIPTTQYRPTVET